MALLASAAALVGAVAALGGHGSAAPPSYTGCLNTSSGTIGSFAEGDQPMSVCKDKETVAHLGGGDVTTVNAGAGLLGGGDGGALTLMVDPPRSSEA